MNNERPSRVRLSGLGDFQPDLDPICKYIAPPRKLVRVIADEVTGTMHLWLPPKMHEKQKKVLLSRLLVAEIFFWLDGVMNE